MARTEISPRLLIPAGALHVIVVALVWRDIARRSPAELRGSPTLWRVATALNTGNAALYLLIGRRR